MKDSSGGDAPNIQVVTVIGGGLIGCSWAALFAAAGKTVRLCDPRPDTDERMQAFWRQVRGDLVAMGLCAADAQPRFEIHTSPAKAVQGADFVKECIPERLPMKQALYAEIEPHLAPHAIVATSSSGLKLSDLQAMWTTPDRLIIAHPFNPPHIIPLVELYGNAQTAPDVIPTARAFFESCGKVTIKLEREVMGHVANRLQAALWREAISLVLEGVANVKDVDTAVWAGPGLRWSVMGPHMLLNLGGGEGGLRAYCEQFKDSYADWWNDLGTPYLTPEAITSLSDGLAAEIGDRDYATLRAERDAKLIGVLRAIADNSRASVPA